MYLIPIRAIAGRVGLTLRTYKKYAVGNAAGLLGAGMDAARATAVVSESALGDYAGGVRLSAAACCLLGPLPAGVRGSAAWLILGRGWGRSGRNSECRWRRCCRSQRRTSCWR
jgi:hypothetical protein